MLLRDFSGHAVTHTLAIKLCDYLKLASLKQIVKMEFINQYACS